MPFSQANSYVKRNFHVQKVWLKHASSNEMSGLLFDSNCHVVVFYELFMLTFKDMSISTVCFESCRTDSKRLQGFGKKLVCKVQKWQLYYIVFWRFLPNLDTHVDVSYTTQGDNCSFFDSPDGEECHRTEKCPILW